MQLGVISESSKVVTLLSAKTLLVDKIDSSAITNAVAITCKDKILFFISFTGIPPTTR
jgi:hypothetical protein